LKISKLSLNKYINMCQKAHKNEKYLNINIEFSKF